MQVLRQNRWLPAIGVAALAHWALLAGAWALDKAKLDAVNQAADAFLALSKDAYKTGTPPRDADPNVKKLLDTVFDTSALSAPGSVAFIDLTALNSWMLHVVGVGSAYVFAGTGIEDPGRVSGLDPAQQEQIAKNTTAYAPEIGRYFDAELALEAALMDVVTAEMSAHAANFQTAKAEQGLAKMRGGVKQTLTGVMTTFLTPGVEVAWMRQRLPALQAIAPATAKFLGAADKKDLRDIAHGVAARVADPEVDSGLDAFARKLDSGS